MYKNIYFTFIFMVAFAGVSCAQTPLSSDAQEGQQAVKENNNKVILIEDITLSDTILSEMKDINTMDSVFIETYYQQSKIINSIMSLDNFRTILTDIIHQNPDTIYKQNEKAYLAAQSLIDNFFLTKYQIISDFKEYSENGSDLFIDYNIKKYISRIFFQDFYEKGTQNELLKDKVQESMQPKVIDEIIKRNKNLANIQKALLFLSKNSKIKLYNI